MHASMPTVAPDQGKIRRGPDACRTEVMIETIAWPPAATELGFIEQAASIRAAGKEQDKETTELNPPSGVTVIFAEADWPAAETTGPLALRLKPTTVMVTGWEVDPV